MNISKTRSYIAAGAVAIPLLAFAADQGYILNVPVNAVGLAAGSSPTLKCTIWEEQPSQLQINSSTAAKNAGGVGSIRSNAATKGGDNSCRIQTVTGASGGACPNGSAPVPIDAKGNYSGTVQVKILNVSDAAMASAHSYSCELNVPPRSVTGTSARAVYDKLP
jgi:hypothetical protein